MNISPFTAIFYSIHCAVKGAYQVFYAVYKLKRGLLLAFCLMLLTLIGTGIYFLASSPSLPAQATVTVSSNEDRIAFLQSYGWIVEEEPYEIVEIIVPSEFDAVYTEYNKIQMEQGYNLLKYSGKRVKRYTYKVTNYPGRSDDNIYANMLIYESRVIGGDISCVALAGFMHGFAYSDGE